MAALAKAWKPNASLARQRFPPPGGGGHENNRSLDVAALAKAWFDDNPPFMSNHPEDGPRRGKLPRLPPESYQGRVSVHWTYTEERRRTGWLTSDFHHRFRELLLHALHRQQLACAVYTLMPDHAHLLVTGLSEQSDQLLFSRYLRRHFFASDDSIALQKQPHDHVLREDEIATDGFRSMAHYIMENPVRAGIVVDRLDYPFTGNLFPGYIDLDWRSNDYWERFWRVYNYVVDR